MKPSGAGKQTAMGTATYAGPSVVRRDRDLARGPPLAPTTKASTAPVGSHPTQPRGGRVGKQKQEVADGPPTVVRPARAPGGGGAGVSRPIRSDAERRHRIAWDVEGQQVAKLTAANEAFESPSRKMVACRTLRTTGEPHPQLPLCPQRNRPECATPEGCSCKMDHETLFHNIPLGSPTQVTPPLPRSVVLSSHPTTSVCAWQSIEFKANRQPKAVGREAARQDTREAAKREKAEAAKSAAVQLAAMRSPDAVDSPGAVDAPGDSPASAGGVRDVSSSPSRDGVADLLLFAVSASMLFAS